MYFHAIRWLINYSLKLKQPNRRPSLSQKLGIGGLTMLIGLLGLILWVVTVRRYQLVLRDEPTIFNTPAIFVYVGITFAAITMLWLWRLSVSHRRKLGWRLFQGPSRGGPLRWEDVLIFVIPAAIYGTIGAGKLVNTAFDRSPTQTQPSKIIRLYTGKSAKGGETYHIWLADWKNSGRPVSIFINKQIFQSHHVGKAVTVKTKRGFLGYEWIEEFK